MERLKPLLDWASDPDNSTVLHALFVAILAAPVALWGLWSWLRGPDTASLIDAIAKQNQSLHATIRKMADHIAAIEATMQAWRRLQ